MLTDVYIQLDKLRTKMYLKDINCYELYAISRCHLVSPLILPCVFSNSYLILFLRYEIQVNIYVLFELME